MKRYLLYILCVMFTLAVFSCSERESADTDAPFDTVTAVPPEEYLPQKAEIADQLSQALSFTIEPADIEIVIKEDQLDAQYHAEILIRRDDARDLLCYANLYLPAYSPAYHVIGQYMFDDEWTFVVDGADSYLFNKTEAEAALERSSDVKALGDYEIKYAGRMLTETGIRLPLIADGEIYSAELTIADNGASYTLTSLEHCVIDKMSLYEFAVGHNYFGLTPIEIMAYTDLPISPEAALTEYYGTVEFDESWYVASEFGQTSYVRIRHDDTDERFTLCQNGAVLNMELIPEDAGWTSVEWLRMSD